MPGWSGTPDELEALAVPLPETVTRFESNLQAAENLVHKLDSEYAKEEEEISELEIRIREQALQHEVPTEEDLREARRRREAGWLLIRRSWLDRDDDPAGSEAFIAALAPGRTLAEAYEKAVVETDALADRLRREAEGVTRKAEWLTRLQQHRDSACHAETESGKEPRSSRSASA